MRRFYFSCYYLLLASGLMAQNKTYSVSNAHSHNDYEQKQPFDLAYNEQFGSIEADIHLLDGQLFVAHDAKDINKEKTLGKLYLNKIETKLKANGGSIYKGNGVVLQLLIDIKTEAIPTLGVLVDLLKEYPGIMRQKGTRIVITGNRPPESRYTEYPNYIHFDGRLDMNYDASALSRIDLLSDDFNKFSNWNGEGKLPVADSQKLVRLITKAHGYKKAVRFWAIPDQPNAWRQMMQLGVDYINTDHIAKLSAYLRDPVFFTREKRLDSLQLHNEAEVMMPYNRIIRSAGSVFRFGDSNQENHALDVAALPGGKQVVVEDRYGIFILDLVQQKIPERWTYTDLPAYKNYLSTYSGIKVFAAGSKTFVVWSAAERDSDQGAVMIAEWNGQL